LCGRLLKPIERISSLLVGSRMPGKSQLEKPWKELRLKDAKYGL